MENTFELGKFPRKFKKRAKQEISSSIDAPKSKIRLIRWDKETKEMEFTVTL